MSHRSAFDRFARGVARFVGHSTAFAAAAVLIALWFVSGPVFGFSNTWQLVINTATTIVTFLMVFVIQNTQNRDGAAVQIKLDEIIRALQGAHNTLLDTEELTEREIEGSKRRYVQLAEDARAERPHEDGDTGAPEVDVR